METIKPTLMEKEHSLEEWREIMLETWEEKDYYETLERQVKKNHSDIFRYMKDYPTHYLGYSVISKLYQLEETIFNIKYQVMRWECMSDFSESRFNEPE